MSIRNIAINAFLSVGSVFFAASCANAGADVGSSKGDPFTLRKSPMVGCTFGNISHQGKLDLDLQLFLDPSDPAVAKWTDEQAAYWMDNVLQYSRQLWMELPKEAAVCGTHWKLQYGDIKYTIIRSKNLQMDTALVVRPFSTGGPPYTGADRGAVVDGSGLLYTPMHPDRTCTGALIGINIADPKISPERAFAQALGMVLGLQQTAKSVDTQNGDIMSVAYGTNVPSEYFVNLATAHLRCQADIVYDMGGWDGSAWTRDWHNKKVEGQSYTPGYYHYEGTASTLIKGHVLHDYPFAQYDPAQGLYIIPKDEGLYPLYYAEKTYYEGTAEVRLLDVTASSSHEAVPGQSCVDTLPPLTEGEYVDPINLGLDFQREGAEVEVRLPPNTYGHSGIFVGISTCNFDANGDGQNDPMQWTIPLPIPGGGLEGKNYVHEFGPMDWQPLQLATPTDFTLKHHYEQENDSTVEVFDMSSRTQVNSVIRSIPPPPEALSIPKARSVLVKVVATDSRTWCDVDWNENRRPDSYCKNGDKTVLRNLRIYAINAWTGYQLWSGYTDKEGMALMEIPLDEPDFLIYTDWAGAPIVEKAPSFQIYYNDALTSSNQLIEPSARTITYTESNLIFPVVPDRWEKPIEVDLTGYGQKPLQIAGTYLTLDYIYSQKDLYVEEYHDYCRLHGCPNNDTDLLYHLAVGITNSPEMTAAGMSNWGSGYILMGNNYTYESAIIHEFGHSLQAWALQLNSSSSGSLTSKVRQLWAEFVRLAYQFNPDATNVIVDGIDFEGPPILAENGTAELNVDSNWKRSWWDVYDTNNEGEFELDNAVCINLPDTVSLSLQEMLDGWRSQWLHFGADDENHAAWEDAGATDDSTNNFWDVAYNIGFATGSTDIESVLLLHNCMQGQSQN